MKLYAILETTNNRLVAFSNAPYIIADCYQIPDIDHDDTLIGKKYNNGVWEDVLQPISEQDKFKSEFAKALGKV
jgi:hypothetical protein